MKNYQLLTKYGLTDFFLNQLSNKAEKKELIGRIVSSHKKYYNIITNTQDVKGIIKGSFLHHKNIFLTNLPAVGDFVVLNDSQHPDYQQADSPQTDSPQTDSQQTDSQHPDSPTFFINRVLTRKNYLSRKLKHERDQEQVIASNLDYIFIVDSILTYNIEKIKRMYFTCLQQNITPVLVLNKIDKKSDTKADEKLLQEIFKDSKILFTSKEDATTLDTILTLLKDNKTGIFIGSSGVGKSSLINVLLKKNQQNTKEVNKFNSKGQHTTTSRELFLLTQGGLIIDTPGIKEFGIWLTEESNYKSNKLIEDIEKYSINCKFRNCKHISEPDCKVLEAIANNLLPKDCLSLYNKIKNEVIDTKNTNEYIKKKQKKKLLSIELKKITRFKKDI